jgi:hypothetical protein
MIELAFPPLKAEIMRLSEATIKQSILHPEEEVRLTALSYFSRSDSDNDSIMPLVVKAIEAHGRSHAFRILRDAEGLTQSPSSRCTKAD